MKFLYFFLFFPILLLPQEFGSWEEIDSLNYPRVGHAMVVLQNGNILVSGSAIIDTLGTNRKCEIYDINTGLWNEVSPLLHPMYGHHMVLLDNGEVLAFGGGTGKHCEIYNPSNDVWRMTDSLLQARNFISGTYNKLLDGRIAIIGGAFWNYSAEPYRTLNDVDIFDILSEKWIKASPLNVARVNHSSVLLSDGRILVSGGYNRELNRSLKSCEIYDPTIDQWTYTDSLPFARVDHSQLLLDNGNILLIGGRSVDEENNTIEYNNCLIFNTFTENWSEVTPIAAYRNSPNVFKVDSSHVLILGGDLNNTWEVYNYQIFQSLHLESFDSNPQVEEHNISKYNTIQQGNGDVMVIGGEIWLGGIYDLGTISPTKKCYIFDFITDIKKTQPLKSKFIIYKNYPNPFNPTTNIAYNIPYSTNVELKIFDILGREVKTLINKIQTAGEYSIMWDGTDNNGNNVTSGVYLYRIKTNNFNKTSKMMLLR